MRLSWRKALLIKKECGLKNFLAHFDHVFDQNGYNELELVYFRRSNLSHLQLQGSKDFIFARTNFRERKNCFPLVCVRKITCGHEHELNMKGRAEDWSKIKNWEKKKHKKRHTRPNFIFLLNKTCYFTNNFDWIHKNNIVLARV